MQTQKEPKKTLLYYYAISMLVLMFLNALVFPSMLKKQVTQTDYGTFLTMLEKGSVRVVEIQETQIGFITKDQSGKDHLYVTGGINFRIM